MLLIAGLNLAAMPQRLRGNLYRRCWLYPTVSILPGTGQALSQKSVS
jgi:hypothetical protein